MNKLKLSGLLLLFASSLALMDIALYPSGFGYTTFISHSSLAS